MAFMTSPDVKVENHGTIFLFWPCSEQGETWIAENVQEDAQWFGNALVVEHRYARDLASGMLSDGLTVT